MIPRVEIFDAKFGGTRYSKYLIDVAETIPQPLIGTLLPTAGRDPVVCESANPSFGTRIKHLY
jgi:hypothetical protein